MADRVGFFRRSSSPILAPLANSVFKPGASPAGVNVLLAFMLCLPDLWRFRRLFEHRAGTSKLMGIELLGTSGFRTSCAPSGVLRHCHISLSTAARTSTSRLGQSRRCRPHAAQPLPDSCSAAVAWRRLDVRPVWCVSGVMLVIYRREPGGAGTDVDDQPQRDFPHQLLAVMFHLTCYGWLISAPEALARSRRYIDLVTGSNPAPSTSGAWRRRSSLRDAVVVVHAIEAYADDVLIGPKLTPACDTPFTPPRSI